MIELSAAADKLLEELKEKGVKLSLIGEKLRVKGKLSEDLKERVREHREGLIQLIKLGEHHWRKAEEWKFGPIEITRPDGKSVDVWMVGVRTDKPGAIKFWFIRNQIINRAEEVTP